jgi:uncharacterized membrane-anchored protein
MSERSWKWLLGIGLALVLIGVNYTIYARERLLAQGEMVLLELAPVDPRSLMQGDYMALNFRVATQLPRGDDERPSQGQVVIRRAGNGVAEFVRMHAGEALAPDERVLDYRVRDGRVRIVTNAWFFEEGKGGRFSVARYGEFRLAPSGQALLVGMRDGELRAIAP